jgi:uncharacterized protein (DUF1697 family)
MGINVAFLRGINVGGKNRLPMDELAGMFEAAGCQAVRTYIQSGNVIFEASAALARRIPGAISQAILAKTKLRVPVVVRSADELARVVRNNPFLATKAERKALHVAFLADEPTTTQVASLDGKRSPPDEFIARGREVYLHLPNGVARTRLTNAYLDSKLKTVSTLRNLNTLESLLGLAYSHTGAHSSGAGRPKQR